MKSTQPTTAELLDAMACLILENDALRQHAGRTQLCEGRRQYDSEALERGHTMNPHATFTPTGTLVIDINH